jgi:hypothetical protein
MTTILDKARAEALFASDRQPSETLTAAEIEAVVQTMVKRLGVRGCAGCVAFEFGDHPEIAQARMDWAREKVAATWPGRTR